MKKLFLILIPTLCIAAIGIFFYLKQTPKITYKTAKIERGNVVATVAATGNVSAVTTVQVGTQVSGTIQKLYVDYNSRVKQGQAIAEIDPSLFNASVEQAQGNRLNAEGNLLKAKVALADSERAYNRNKKLLADGIISQGDFENVESAYHTAKAAVSSAEGLLAQTKGALKQAQTNLHYSIIRSPVDGFIISRSIDIGQTVAASFQTPTLFTIAKDLTKMQIEVSVDEADISSIKLQQKATFTVDAYPEQTFKGNISQIRSAPIVTQNVVTYVVVVTVDNSDLKLKPGMTANVSIEVDRKDDVLKIPPAALRFKPKSDTATNKENKRPKPDSTGVKNAGKGERKAKGQQVYILKEGQPVAISVKTGIANSVAIELVEGELKESDEIVVEQVGGNTKKKASSMSSSPMGPRM